MYREHGGDGGTVGQVGYVQLVALSTVVEGELLLVSQFTLAGSTQKGLRPSFSSAMPPEPAKALYEELVAWMQQEYPATATGVFGADMKISLENDGPVTFILKS